MPLRRWLIATGALAAAAAVLVWRARAPEPPPPPPPPVIRLTFPAPPGHTLGAGDETLDAAISPDERSVAFVASRDGVPSLWRRSLDDETATPLPGTEGAQLPVWSPSGRAIAFFSGGRLRRVSLDDGTLGDLADAPEPRGAAWLSETAIVFAGGDRGALQRVENGAITAFTTIAQDERGHVFPVSTDTGALTYVSIRTDGRRTIRLRSDAETRDLTVTAGHGVVIGGTLLHVRDDTLVAQALPATPEARIGRSVPLALGVGTSAAGRALVTATRRLLLFASAARTPAEIAWFDLAGARLDTLGEPGDFRQVRLSPDDGLVAVTTVQPQVRTLDVFLLPGTPRAGPARQMTFALARDSDPVWSPDGTRVLFQSMRTGRANLFVRAARAGDQEDAAVFPDDEEETPSDWIAGGRGGRLLFSAPAAGRGSNVRVLDLGTGARADVAATPFNEHAARWSPDRAWIAYLSDDFGRDDVFVLRQPDGRRFRVSTAGGTHPRWGRDGRTLYFLRGDRIMRATRQDSAESPFATPEPLARLAGVRDFDLAHRADRLLAIVPAAAGGEIRPDVRVVLDWQGLGR